MVYIRGFVLNATLDFPGPIMGEGQSEFRQVRIARRLKNIFDAQKGGLKCLPPPPIELPTDH